MNDFWLLVELGFSHVWDWQGYDHLLFLMALCLPFSMIEWKKLLWLITYFTIGHSLSLVIASLDLLTISSTWIEFLIPLSIAATALHNIIFAQRRWLNSSKTVMWVDTWLWLCWLFRFDSRLGTTVVELHVVFRFRDRSSTNRIRHVDVASSLFGAQRLGPQPTWFYPRVV